MAKNKSGYDQFKKEPEKAPAREPESEVLTDDLEDNKELDKVVAEVEAPKFELNEAQSKDADSYNAAFLSGKAVPAMEIRKDADPLLVECFHFLERVQAAGLLIPYATNAYNVLCDLTIKLKDNLKVR